MDHSTVDRTSSSTLMLPNDKVVVLAPNNRILIREDTILTNLQGCAGCGRTQFTCSGIEKQWSVLCWGQRTDRRYYCFITLLSATFALSLLGTVFFCFTNTINDAIVSNMALRNNSIAFSMWRRPTVRPLMKVHLFNYTNWQRVRDGQDQKLHLQDVGPYVYSQQLERVNIKFDGDQLSYQERNNFQYLPEKSVGAHYDQVFVPNLPLLGVVSKSMNLPFLAQITLKTTLSTFANHNDAFLKLPVQRFLWGYDDGIIDLAKPVLSLKGQLNFDKFGLLVTKNGTVSDRMTINTGENDKDRMNILEKFNGQRQLSNWGSSECNRIDASDGTIFPPSMLDRKKSLHVFYANLCRRLPFNYIKDVEIDDGIQLLRYGMPDMVFDDPPHFPPNQCFCDVDTGECPPRGVINVTACAMGAPAFASFPHFHRGDPALRAPFTGLDPNPELHESYLDIHPTLGISLSGKSSVDPFTRKDWYDVKAPSMFTKRQVGTTLVNRTQGTKIASEGLKGRVFEVSLADLQADTDAERSFRKFRLIAEDVQGRNVLCNFHGMDLTTDKLRWMVKKWQTLIEANIDVKTTDGYLLRVFCIGFTNKDSLSQRKTCYAQHTQVRAIRKKMCEIITRDVATSELREVVNKLIPDSIAKDIEKACHSIYPLRDVCIRKVKVLKRPRFEIAKLMELHGEGGGGKRGEAGDKSERPEGYEPPVQESV